MADGESVYLPLRFQICRLFWVVLTINTLLLSFATSFEFSTPTTLHLSDRLRRDVSALKLKGGGVFLTVTNDDIWSENEQTKVRTKRQAPSRPVGNTTVSSMVTPVMPCYLFDS